MSARTHNLEVLVEIAEFSLLIIGKMLATMYVTVHDWLQISSRYVLFHS